MEMNDYGEINKMLANLSLKEETSETTENLGNQKNDNNNRTQETNYDKSRKTIENVFSRDLNFYQRNAVREIERSVDTRLSMETEQYPDTNKLLNERGFMPNSSVFPPGNMNRNGNINVVREDMPLSTRVISNKKQYRND